MLFVITSYSIHYTKLYEYGVVAKNPFPEQVSLIPTDLNFEICPYIDTNGNPTSDYDEYTLNYLIMSKGNPLPSPVQFAWNWVDKDQIALYSGVMSVNRNIFITFLQNLFSETLQNIAYQPQAHFSTRITSYNVCYTKLLRWL